MAVTILSSISEDEANWLRETSYWMHVSDEITAKNAMEREKKKAIEESLKTGHATGLAEGIEKGIAQGHLEGKKETQINTAKNCLAMGFSNEQISQITGLTVEEIEKLP